MKNNLEQMEKIYGHEFKRKVKKICEECHNEFNHVLFWKGKWVCRKCFNKNSTLITFHPDVYKPRLSEEQALNKIYKVRGYITKKNSRTAHLQLPPCLIGKYFKIILVDEKDVPEKYRFKKLKLKKIKSPENLVHQKSQDIFSYGTSMEDVNKIILGEVQYEE